MFKLVTVTLSQYIFIIETIECHQLFDTFQISSFDNDNNDLVQNDVNLETCNK